MEKVEHVNMNEMADTQTYGIGMMDVQQSQRSLCTAFTKKYK